MMKNDPATFTMKNTTPSMENVFRTPYVSISVSETGVNTSQTNQRAETIITVTRPLLSGNHFWQQAIVVVYARPMPIPPNMPYVSQSSHGVVSVMNLTKKNPDPSTIPAATTTSPGFIFSCYLPPMVLPTVRSPSSSE